jgi:polyhydroxyalkanoate synthesis repressor PhaR
MRTIKKYANRKLYDTEAKQYISMDGLTELIRSGEEIEVIDNTSGEDITVSVLSQLLARQSGQRADGLSAGTLVELLRRGGGTLAEVARKSFTFGHSALHLAEDELDKVAGLLSGGVEMSEEEGRKLKGEIQAYAGMFKQWTSEKIDQRINDVMEKLKIATRERADALDMRLNQLERRIRDLESKAAAGPDTDASH